MRSIVSERQLGVLFDVVLLVKVQTRNQEGPERFLGRRVENTVHLRYELRYVSVYDATKTQCAVKI